MMDRTLVRRDAIFTLCLFSLRGPGRDANNHITLRVRVANTILELLRQHSFRVLNKQIVKIHALHYVVPIVTLSTIYIVQSSIVKYDIQTYACIKYLLQENT